MKKKLIITIIVFLTVVVLKYTFSNYDIKYKVDGYEVKSNLYYHRLYTEIAGKYNFDIYTNSKKKIIIKRVNSINIDNYECIIPIINGIDTYPLCYDTNEKTNIDYYLIDNDILNEYKSNVQTNDKKDKDYVFYNNLKNNVYIALWTYKGYTIMDNNGYKNITLFDKDRYDNDLAYQIDNRIYMPNYNMEHEFNELYSFDIKNGNYYKIPLTKKIDYDSYIVGNIGKKIYLYDNKNSKLYEINIKNGKIKTIGSSENGYVKYYNGKFITCSKNDYKIDKVKITEEEKSNYIYESDIATYKMFKDNKDIKSKIVDNKIDIIKEYKDDMYYKYKDIFYVYNPKFGSTKIFYDSELSFNNSKSIFVYID